MGIANLKKSSRHAPRAVRPAVSAAGQHAKQFRRFRLRVNGTRSVPTSLRRGMSLIELLVVVTILLVAAAVFVPRLKPMMDHSRSARPPASFSFISAPRGIRRWPPGEAAA
jgi:prepilin-type N-terminal cleavage/methylation domain-containing protein